MLPAGYLAKNVSPRLDQLAPTGLDQGKFNNSEPGPYRIFAVYSVPWP
jgi:hypothetical protein